LDKFRIPLLIGLRYTGARQKNNFISFISLVSVLGLMLGVAVLVIVVSVMNGFDRELRGRILGVVPHGIVTPGEGANAHDRQAVVDMLSTVPDVLGTAPFLRTRGMLSAGGDVSIVEIYGVSPDHEDRVSIIPQHMQFGKIKDLAPGTNTIVLGRGLAMQLGIFPGQSLTLILPESSSSGQMVRPRLVQVRLAGTFEVEAELDYTLALMNIQDLSGILDVSPALIGTRIRFQDLLQAPARMAEINRLLVGTATESWADQYGDLFSAVEMEKSMMFLLLLLIIAIASFNIISGLVMLVDEKKSDIAILRTLGISPGSVMAVFIIQGSILGVIGTTAGILAGTLLAINITDIVGFFENIAGQQVLAGTYFDSVPSELRINDLAVIALTSLVISITSTIYPAWRASTLHPADVLRYE
jgi:lipoprotein-releasing system permease protein